MASINKCVATIGTTNRRSKFQVVRTSLGGGYEPVTVDLTEAREDTNARAIRDGPGVQRG